MISINILINKIFQMNFILIFLIIQLFIIKSYCSLHNLGKEELAALILAASDYNGNIAKDNNNYFRFKIGKDAITNQDIEGSIIDLIPELRRHDPNTVNDYFKNELYPNAVKIFEEYFGVNSITNGISVNTIDQLVNNYDIINRLIRSLSSAEPKIFSSVKISL